jgi:transposase-like protein
LPSAIVRHAIWLCLRFALRDRDIADLLAERGFDIAYETSRRWVGEVGPLVARRQRRCRPKPSAR